ELIVRFLAKKSWNEKNFQVSTKVYAVLTLLAERSSTFGKPSAALAIPHLTEKLGDTKLKKPAADTLMLFGEKTSLSFVFSQAYDPLSKQKAPKVIADATTWMKDALTEFGIAGLSLRPLIGFLQNALKNSNAAVRSSATNTLVTLKLFAGAAVKDFLDDLNPQLMGTIEKEFEKVDGQTAPEPTRTQADVAPVVASGGQSKAADPMEELYPRVDIDRLLVGTTILADSKSDAWKARKEALEKFQGLLEANKRFKPNLGDIGQVLKARVVDQNKAVQALALDIISRIATGINKPFEKYSRLFAVPVATVLADQKAPIRMAAMGTLTAIATACEGIDSLVHGLAAALEAQNPLQRSTLLGWLSDWFKDHPPTSSQDLSEFSTPAVMCLDDRSADVRKAAQNLLPYLIQNVGFDALVKETNPLKPASRSAILPILQALKPANAGLGAPAAGAAPAKPEAAGGASTLAKPRGTGVSRPLSMVAPSTATSRPESRAESEIEQPGSARLPVKSKLTALKKTAPAIVKAEPVVNTNSANPAPFFGSNPDAKKARLAKDVGRWTIEAGPVRKDLAEFLQAQMDNHTSKDLSALLFSQGHNATNDWVSGMTTVAECYTNTLAGDERYGPTNQDMKAILIANSDLSLKYACLRVHENQSNVVGKTLDVAEAVQNLLAADEYRLTDAEAACFLPTFIHKLPKIYPYGRIFQNLLEHGLKSKNAKTRQGSLDELANVLKGAGLSACDPPKAFPIVASMIGDKDASVRKSALSVLRYVEPLCNIGDTDVWYSEAYILEGEKIWSHVGTLSLKDKGQLEERLRRVPTNHPPASPAPQTTVHAPNSRLSLAGARAESPALVSKLARPMSPAVTANGRASPATGRIPQSAAASPSPASRATQGIASPSANRSTQGTVAPVAVGGPARPKSLVPSRLGPARGIPQPSGISRPASTVIKSENAPERATNGHAPQIDADDPDDISLTISHILSHDPVRSVDALKKIQKVLELSPDAGKNDSRYRELADHTEGLIETVTTQMYYVFEHDILDPANFRLAKHLIQTLNAFCDHPLLSESLSVSVLRGLLEELTLRLLITDESNETKVKDLSKFINMILLRLFATGRRITIFRWIVKPFPMNGTTSENRQAKVAELVLKCIWKLARNIPDDLKNQILDPVELFPAIEQFLQSIPPNDWRARATNKIPSGDMPLRTVKVIIQHIVAFDDPSATIVYPYVYRILNARPKEEAAAAAAVSETAPASPIQARSMTPQSTRSSTISRPRQDSTTSRASTQYNQPSGRSTPTSQATIDPDLDDQLNAIWLRASAPDGAMHKDAINDLWNFIKAHPEMKPRVDAMIDGTGGVYMRYIRRALASRQAEDDLRSGTPRSSMARPPSLDMTGQVPSSPVRTPGSPRRSIVGEDESAARMKHFHDMFNYNGRSSIVSNGSSRSSVYDGQHPGVQAHLESLRKRDSMAFNGA
ncbi:10009_t:CDS:2, partial [Acaulospora colombiana]